MLHLRQTIILALMMMLSVAAKAENAYIYGIAFSPTDSVIYMTDIRMLENVTINKKTLFLASRNGYASQMKKYMESIGVTDYVCATVYKPTYKQIYTDYTKLKKQYEKKGILINTIDQLKFQFQPIVESK